MGFTGKHLKGWKPDKKVLLVLIRYLQRFFMLIFMGFWCLQERQTSKQLLLEVNKQENWSEEIKQAYTHINWQYAMCGRASKSFSQQKCFYEVRKKQISMQTEKLTMCTGSFKEIKILCIMILTLHCYNSIIWCHKFKECHQCFRSDILSAY